MCVYVCDVIHQYVCTHILMSHIASHRDVTQSHNMLIQPIAPGVSFLESRISNVDLVL